MPLQNSGEIPKKPGEYIETGPKGGKIKNPRQVSMELGDTPLPPTQEPNRKWKRIGKVKP